MSASKLSAFCDRFLEAGWLLGVTITPVFFNVYSQRVFEPDKLTTLRALATIMAVFWLIRFIEGWRHKKTLLPFTWRTPLVLVALVTMGVYVLSSLFSLVPYTSFVGSYQRLQGTYTLFAYLVIFFALLTGLHTREQLNRLITVLILNSLPVALYGIIQRNGLDPLPWAGDVQRRVAANMGNAIFVAAYLIMIAPLTGAKIVESFQDILRREPSRVTDILRAAGYIFIFVVQVLTIIYSQSRGPFLGIGLALLLFPYLLFLLLQRQAVMADPEKRPWYRDLLSGLGLAAGSLAVIGALAGLGMVLPINGGTYIGGGLGVLISGGFWLRLIMERKGWRWLWIGWAFVGLLLALALLAINLPGPLQDRVRENPTFGRMTRLLQWESGSGRVRTLIWEGVQELVTPHAPLKYPDGRQDTWNSLRPLIGYGPESMYVAYNSFYKVELGHIESRNASPDRSHNETLDTLVNSGVLGLGVYVWLFGAIVYWGLHWLGLLGDRRQFWLWVGLMAGITLALWGFFIYLGRAYLFAVALPLGMVAGTGVYLTWAALRVMVRGKAAVDPNFSPHPHSLLLAALVSAILGHFVEINFGIAIAATRTTFWAFAALLVVLGLQWVPPLVEAAPVPEPAATKGPSGAHARAKHRPQRSQPRNAPGGASWVIPVVVLSLTALFLLGTLAYDFINNPAQSSNAAEIFWNSLTLIYVKQQRAFGGLMIVVFTALLFGVIGLGELEREGLLATRQKTPWSKIVLTYAGIVGIGFLLFAGIIAGTQAQLTQTTVQTIEDIVALGMQLANTLGNYYALIFVIALAIAWLLSRETSASSHHEGGWNWGVLVVGVLLASFLLVGPYCYDLVRADILYKQGLSFANSTDPTKVQVGIAHYEKALELAPKEDYYMLFLGKALLAYAQSSSAQLDDTARLEIFQRTEEVLLKAQQIAPLNTDHSANLARFYRSWSSRTTGEEKTALLRKAETYYQQALTLSPNNPVLWNELAILYAFDLQDQAAYARTIAHSLALDPEFEETWSLSADVKANIQKDLPGAIADYKRVLELSPRQCTVRRVLANLQLQEQLWTDAESLLQETTTVCPTMTDLWDIYRMWAIAVYYEGDTPQAVTLAEQALALAPEAQRETVQQLVDFLLQPVNP